MYLVNLGQLVELAFCEGQPAFLEKFRNRRRRCDFIGFVRDDPDRAYVSRARPMFETRFESPYDHLARVREWALVEADSELP